MRHAREALSPGKAPQEKAERRADHVVERGIVESAGDGLFLVERRRVEPSGNLGFDRRTVGHPFVDKLPSARMSLLVGSMQSAPLRLGGTSASRLAGLVLLRAASHDGAQSTAA